MESYLSEINAIVWGVPALTGILGAGLYLTLRLEFVQFHLLPKALAAFWRQLRPKGGGGEGGSSFRALCTALAATVGTGNLVGVAGAICLGGPGAVFWMWVCGFLGMVTKFSEAVLALRFRVREDGSYRGGPMYVITRGLGRRYRPLACIYCLFGIAASFGVGNAAQVNAVVDSVQGLLAAFGGELPAVGELLLGIFLAFLVGSLLFGGAGAIGAAAEGLVPFVSAGYILLCAVALTLRLDAIPGALWAMVEGAFSPKAVTGGVLGSAFQALRTGCSRGVFTNEAGMGTASIAHACARVRHPVEQGLMGIVEVFLDTIVICTLTALVILTSGVPIPYGTDAGGSLTVRAFTAVCGGGAPVFLSFAMGAFALATILGWGLYGGCCAQFLFGNRAWRYFAAAQTLTVVLGAVMDTAAVWQISELLNGLMVIPNLIALVALTPELRRLTKEYKKTGSEDAGGGYYADIHQRKPL